MPRLDNKQKIINFLKSREVEERLINAVELLTEEEIEGMANFMAAKLAAEVEPSRISFDLCHDINGLMIGDGLFYPRFQRWVDQMEREGV